MGINSSRPPGDVRGVGVTTEDAELTSTEQQIVAEVEGKDARRGS